MASRRKKSDRDAWIVAGLCIAFVAASGLIWLLHEIASHPFIDAAVCLALAAAAFGLWHSRRRRRLERAERAVRLRVDLTAIDNGDWLALEHVLTALLDRDGLLAEHVGKANDQAVDVLGTDGLGRRFAIQCKHTRVSGNVGAPVLYKINGTAASCYAAAVSVVVTNGGFTKPAVTWGNDPAHRVHLIDRHALRQWGLGHSLFEVLGLPVVPPHGASSAALAARSGG